MPLSWKIHWVPLGRRQLGETRTQCPEATSVPTLRDQQPLLCYASLHMVAILPQQLCMAATLPWELCMAAALPWEPCMAAALPFRAVHSSSITTMVAGHTSPNPPWTHTHQPHTTMDSGTPAPPLGDPYTPALTPLYPCSPATCLPILCTPAAPPMTHRYKLPAISLPGPAADKRCWPQQPKTSPEPLTPQASL